MDPQELLDALLKDKSPKEIEALELTAAMTKLTGVLHTLLCPHDHEKDCDFYVPEIAVCDSESRKEWLQRTERLCEKAGVTTASQVHDAIAAVLLVARNITTVPNLILLSLLLPALTERQVVALTSQPAQPSASLSGPSNSAESAEQ